MTRRRRKPDPVVQRELGHWIGVVNDAVFYARVAARSKGYALAVHGTLRRDVDVVAVPWTAEACGADELAKSIAEYLASVKLSFPNVWEAAKKTRERKPFGRIAWAIVLRGIPAPYIDLSVAPRAWRGAKGGK